MNVVSRPEEKAVVRGRAVDPHLDDVGEGRAVDHHRADTVDGCRSTDILRPARPGGPRYGLGPRGGDAKRVYPQGTRVRVVSVVKIPALEAKLARGDGRCRRDGRQIELDERDGANVAVFVAVTMAVAAGVTRVEHIGM